MNLLRFAPALLLCLPATLLAQSKKERRKFAAQQAALVATLRQDVTALAADEMEGRRAGTAGEQKAIAYLVQRWQQEGLAPAGAGGSYQQTFHINEGLRTDAATNYFRCNGQALQLNNHYYPLAWSQRRASLKGDASPSLAERNEPWFVDVKEWLEENAANPHYNLEAALQAEAKRAKNKGATALIVHNSSSRPDNLLFNKFDTVQAALPVVFVTEAGRKTFFADATGSYRLELAIHIQPSYRQATNLAAFIDNGAPQTVVLGAHYDHLGYGEDNNSLDGAGQIHNGADDNASGTAALTLLGRLLKNNAAARGNNYLLLAFSAEELGLLGSKHWLDSPTLRQPINFMINMDMVGRYSADRMLTVGGFGTSPQWAGLLPQANGPLLQLALKTDSSGSGPSDHASFYRKQIPVLFLFTNSHADYHKASDDADKINYEGLAQIVTFTKDLLEKASSLGKLNFTATREASMGRSATFKVALGVIPDYAYAGTGLRIDGVSKGKLGEKLGLQAGDVLLQLGDYKFVDVQSYMQALSKFKAGDCTTLIVQRGAETKTYSITF